MLRGAWAFGSRQVGGAWFDLLPSTGVNAPRLGRRRVRSVAVPRALASSKPWQARAVTSDTVAACAVSAVARA